MADKYYDYIICGGGTSGCVLAGRLAENIDARILLIEAGPDSADLENVHMVGGWSNNFDSETDWNIVTEPQSSADGRQIKCSRGRLLGGSSGVNGTLCIRGVKQDFDDWKLDGWTGEDMWRCMNKSETFHNKPWFNPSFKDHGYDGPLHLEPHDLAPISELVKQSMIEKSLPLHEDMFATGETSTGCGHALRTVYEGIRTTAADFVSKGYRRDNVTIQTDATVDKVIISEGSNGLRATGVEMITKSGEKITAHARKEVIVSAGAYGSPAILLRSGLGPKEELEKVGITPKVNLPGVGKNLLDHPVCWFFYEVDRPGLTLDHLVHHDQGFASSYKLYKEKKTGVFSTFPFGIFAYTRLDKQLNGDPLWEKAPRWEGRDAMGLTPSQPNVEFFNTEMYGGPKQWVDFPTDHRYVVGMCTVLFSARSRGSVTLRSSNPLENPIVDHQYLADPLDLLVLTQGCQTINNIMTTGSATKDLIKGSWPPRRSHHQYTSRKEWEPYVKETVTTCYHPGGTCKMGQITDPMAVLDEQLRVRGVKGLRVVDVSVMPELNNGHTQSPAYGIGERAAEIIKEDSKKASKL
ncbi:hypothetical protein A1O1_08977 [Capronia coronata CBS 617.96]|uniref:Glucose-methanol-choline oxidoreductase N-terminal domain-containing protein n=1 Tax=Capronia coronata CBS 617.96 TaxID=1182541 RepID=W9XNN8_9EURO|nr:uncharacterized protein A1O1_08977 [Capronia coronata CBS 617.96]EXJ78576.1 hypothetical protein A1O1_08977 [Capronia coronata CBS 617.96]